MKEKLWLKPRNFLALARSHCWVGPEVPFFSGNNVITVQKSMTTKQIREFNPNIGIQFAQAYLNTQLVSTDGSPERLINLAKSLIRSNKIGHWMVQLTLTLLIVEILGAVVWWLFFPNQSGKETLLAYSVVSGTILGIMFGTIMQEPRHRTIERAFLDRLHDLQESYGDAPLDFLNWDAVKEAIKWELASRADDVKFLEKEKGQNHPDTEFARTHFKSLFGLCANFKHLSIDGQNETPYFHLFDKISIWRPQ